MSESSEPKTGPEPVAASGNVNTAVPEPEPPTLADDLRAMPDEIARTWRQMPDRWVVVALVALWCGLFQWLGNSTLGFVKTTSLFQWMYYVMSTSEGDELGLYIPWVVFGLAYWKREELLLLRKEKWWPAFLLVLFALALHVVGFLVQQTRVSIVAFFIGLYGILGMIWGWRMLLGLFFPFCLFVFCVPLATETDRITLPLRLMAAKITTVICKGALGINVINDGTVIFDPSGKYQYEIAAACSGIKSLSATAAISVIAAFTMFKTVWRRALMIGMAFPLAVLGNVLRLTAVIVASEAFGKEAGMFVHDNSLLSLLPYIPAILGVFLMARLLEEKKKEPEAEGPKAQPAGVAAGG